MCDYVHRGLRRSPPNLTGVYRLADGRSVSLIIRAGRYANVAVMIYVNVRGGGGHEQSSRAFSN